MKTLLKCLLMFFIISLFGCKKNENPNNGSNNNNNNNQTVFYPKILQIADAEALFIGKSGMLKRGGGDSSRIFKITKEGLVLEVISKDDRDSNISSFLSPVSLFNLNDNYFTVTYFFQRGTRTIPGGNRTYLVRKSDGVIFTGEKLISSNVVPGSEKRATELLFEDQNNNLYYPYMGSNGPNPLEIVKLNITNPDALTTERYSASGDYIDNFVVDISGNALYTGKDATQKWVTRFRHHQNGFKNLEAYGQFFLSADRQAIYVMRTSFTGIEKNTLMKINPESVTLEPSPDTAGLSFIRKICNLKGRNKILILGTHVSGGEGIFEYTGSNPHATAIIPLSHLGLLPIANGSIMPVDMMIASNTNYFILGHDPGLKKVILKVNGGDHSYIKIAVTDDYEIQELVCGKNDELNFYGLRMSDGKRVLCSISNTGTVSVLKVMDDMTISSLQRIN